MENYPPSAPASASCPSTPAISIKEQKTAPKPKPKETPLLEDTVKSKNDISVSDVHAMIDQLDALEAKGIGTLNTLCTMGKNKYNIFVQTSEDGDGSESVISIAKLGTKAGDLANLEIKIVRTKGLDAHNPGSIEITMNGQNFYPEEGAYDKSVRVASISMNTTYNTERANLQAVNGALIKKQLARFLPFIMKAEHPASQF